mmetsp:Transcript_17504/g.39663  ORF Transcript_17504/g.39663 Transcript_17504/m.39663 type:complete len:299 (-) Transcript_17504:794-1690(-)
MTFLSILPVDVSGISSQTSTSSGSWNLANFLRQCSATRSCRPWAGVPGASITTATGRSSHLGCGTATTEAMDTPSIAAMWFSRSMEEIHSPPDLMTSLDLSLMIIAPSLSIYATSPVMSQPLWNLSGALFWKYSPMIHGPRTRTSPASPCGRSLSRSSVSTIFNSTPGMGMPALAMFPKRASGLFERSECTATRFATVPRGLVSVIPQTWVNSTPSLSRYQPIISAGGDEPPQTSDLSFSFAAAFSTPNFSMAVRTPCQTVGTPVLSRTSQSMTVFRRLSGSMKRPVKTVRAPVMRLT